MRVVAAITEPGALTRILKHAGEPPEPPRISGPRAPPSGEKAEMRDPALPASDIDDNASY